MADDDNENENPLTTILARADEIGLDGDERDDYIQSRMARAGFRKGPGDWVSADDDDDDGDQEDDDQPVTRGDWRKMQRERKKAAVRKPAGKQGDGGQEGKKTEKRAKRDPWW